MAAKVGMPRSGRKRGTSKTGTRKSKRPAKGRTAPPSAASNPYQEALNEAKANPSPDEAEKEAIARARERFKGRAPRFNMAITGEGEAWSIASPHSDLDGWVHRLRDVFGTPSGEFAAANVERLSNIVRRKDPESSRGYVNAALASIEAIGPKDELEAMLAVQMAATHDMQMNMLCRLKNTDTLEGLEAYGNLATKLARTFTAQVDALAKLRRGGEQTVRVEHVHVYPGGKAVVGTVNNHPRGDRGQNENCEQPHATDDGNAEAVRKVTYAPGVPLPALWSENPERELMPVAGGQREGPLPDARGS